MDNIPFIVNINQNSLDDGPGIRTVLFFKGCSLNCVWCQNPGTKRPNQELIFQPASCIHCPQCTVRCTNQAFLYKSNSLLVSWDLCSACDRDFPCVDQCPAGVFETAGKQYPIADLMQTITSNKIFYKNTGGGVTLSGGEPLLFPQYIRQLVERLLKENISYAIETAGQFPMNEDTRFILQHADVIYYDIKIFDSNLHQKHCGSDNQRILSNFAQILSEINPQLPTNLQTLDFKYKRVDEPIFIPRIPLIPGITATPANLHLIVDFFKTSGIQVIDLLAYNPLWHSKAQSLGKSIEYEGDKWMTEAELAIVREICAGFIFEKFI